MAFVPPEASVAENIPEALKAHNHTKQLVGGWIKEMAWIRKPLYPFELKRPHIKALCKITKLDPNDIVNNAPKKRTVEFLRTIWNRDGKFRLLFLLIGLSAASIQTLGLPAIIAQIQIIFIWWESELDQGASEVLQAEYEMLCKEDYFEGLPGTLRDLAYTDVPKADLVDFLQHYNVTCDTVRLYFLKDGSVKVNLDDPMLGGYCAEFKINAASWVQYQYMKQDGHLY